MNAITPLTTTFRVLEPEFVTEGGERRETGRHVPQVYTVEVTRTGKRMVAVNQKGGVAKTTTTINVAAELEAAGMTVLVVDLDPQANASTGLGVDPDEAEATMFEVLNPTAEDRIPAAEAIMELTPRLHLIPGHLALAAIEESGAGPATETLLSRMLRPIKDNYHAILVDCPPNLGRLTVMGMAGGPHDEVDLFIPVKCGPYELNGLAKLLDTVDKLKANDLGDHLNLKAVIATMYNGTRKVDQNVDTYLADNFPDEYVSPPIRGAVRVVEAASAGEPCRSFAPAEPINGDIANLARVLTERTLA